jgi:fermentation-respiration switch protein FrsA (DUF1100 family)
MIFPGHSLQGQPDTDIQPTKGAEVVSLVTASGDLFVCLYGSALEPNGRPHPNPSAQPTILYFYGNGECIQFSQSVFERFRRLGCNVLIAEYIGFGVSGGSPSETNCEQTADAAYAYLLEKRNTTPDKIYACGWSLGGAVAVGLASRRPVAGLMIFSTFTSAADMGKRMLPFLPVKLLLTHRFDSVTKIAAIQAPILIAHGRQDTIVPFDMAETLANTAKRSGKTVETLWLDHAGHNDFYDFAGAEWEEALRRFIRKTQE